MVTVKEFSTESRRKLQNAGIDPADLDVLVLLEHFLGVGKAEILAKPELIIPKDKLPKLEDAIDRRIDHFPLAYITGVKEFYGRNFIVDENVLVPRPETEILVEALLGRAKDGDQVLDVGTGSGVIAISAKLENPTLIVEASDVSASALKIAEKNAKSYNAEVKLTKSNLFSNVVGRFDVIAGNLPYGSKTIWQDKLDKLKHEPQIALVSGDSAGMGLIEKLMLEAPNHLKDGGTLIVEHDPIQKVAVEGLAQIVGYGVENKSDYVTVLSSLANQEPPQA